MEINYVIVISVLIVIIVLIVFLIQKNRKDKKKFEKEIIASETTPEKHDKERI